MQLSTIQIEGTSCRLRRYLSSRKLSILRLYRAKILIHQRYIDFKFRFSTSLRSDIIHFRLHFGISALKKDGHPHLPVIVDETRLQGVAVECRRDEGAGYGEDIHVTSCRGRWRRQRRRRRRPLNLLHVRGPSSCTTTTAATTSSTSTTTSSPSAASSPAAPTPSPDAAGPSRGGRDVRRTIERPPI